MRLTALRIAVVTSAILIFSGPFSLAQHLRIGLVAGTPVTVDYPALTMPGYETLLPDGTILTVPHRTWHSLPRTVIGGPALGWQVNDRLSIEGSAIYRRLRIEGLGPTVTWQFPVLAKYRFPLSPVTPFLEAGPSFRTTGNRNTSPSHAGFSAGTGLDVHWHGLRISPTIRYTRWARGVWFTHPSKQDQLEALVYFTAGPQSDRHPLGRRMSAGIVAGGVLNRPGREIHFSTASGVEFPSSYDRQPQRSFLLGPHVELRVTDRWSLAAEAVYRPQRVWVRTTGAFQDLDGSFRRVEVSQTSTGAVLWQFPVLAKYRFRSDGWRPYLEVGPSFRLPQDFGGNLSSFGFTAGAGVDANWKSLHFEPGLRFSHFGPARTRIGTIEPNYTYRNQFDALCVFRF
jgi:opacity protein-like surface antigen